jgi:hypothetical protein
MEEKSMEDVMAEGQSSRTLEKQQSGVVMNTLGKLKSFREGTLFLIIIFVCVVMSFASPTS